MTAWMALFGLVWLLRVRGSLCGCAACKRARHELHDTHEPHSLHESHSSQHGLHEPQQFTQSPREERAPFDVIALQQYTRDATVQTDFDDEIEDLDKIELQITEECKLDSGMRGPYRVKKVLPHGRYELQLIGGSYGKTTSAAAEHMVAWRGEWTPESCASFFDSNVGNYECGREQTMQSPGSGAGSYQYPSDADSEAVWETSDVTLERGASGLGLSIAGGETGGDVSITKIAAGGAAKVDGRLQIGDILLQVNDISVEGVPHSVAVDALQKAGNVVRLRVRRARRPKVVTLWRGVRGLGLGIAGGADNAGGGGVFVSHIAVGGAAHHDARLRLGDKILAVRDEDGIETSLVGATHAQAVTALRNTGEHVTLVVLPAASFPPVSKAAPLYSTKTQATSCSTLHELLEEEPTEIPRCVRMVRLVRSGSRLGMDIVGGLGGEAESTAEDDTCGVFVSGVSSEGAAFGMLHRGDRILSVDGRDLTRATHEQAAAALKYSGTSVTIAAQYQPDQYERLRARIRAINAAAVMSPPRHATHVPVHDTHVMYPR